MRIGMIGAGGIARTHAEHLRGMDGVRIAAVMDPVPERAEALAAGCGARTHADLEPLLDEWTPCTCAPRRRSTARRSRPR